MRFIFKQKIGTLPYEVEDISGENQLFYSSFDVNNKLKDIDRNFVELMSGSKFVVDRMVASPKKIKFMEDRLSSDYGFKTMKRTESDMLES